MRNGTPDPVTIRVGALWGPDLAPESFRQLYLKLISGTTYGQ